MSEPLLDNDSRVGDLVLAWEERCEQGVPVSLEELCRDCPELLPEVQRQVAALRAMNPLLAEPEAPPDQANTLVPQEPGELAVTLQRPDQPSPAGRLTAGPSVPGYEILRELGRGGMGVVYLARQQSLGRLVALKMILAGPYTSAVQRQRFRAEAEVVARLAHPNIVQVHEVGEHDGRLYCVLEYVEGGNLADALDGTPCPPRTAAELIATLARAVQAAHEAGVVHRDLKPANVLLVGADLPVCPGEKDRQECLPPRVKVTDFGLAKRLDDDRGLTETGQVMGTPSYMAPEQAHGKKDVGPAADLYALGAILYEALTGRPPLLGATALETLTQVLADDPLPPRKLNSAVPRDLETICLKCLAKDPARRYGSARDLADDLGRFLAGEPIRARPTPPVERAVKWAGRHRALAALIAVCFTAALLGVGGGVAYNTQLRHERDRANEARRDAEESQQAADTARDQALRDKARAEENFRLAQRVVADLSEKLSDGKDWRVEDLRKELLTVALAYYQEFVRQRGDDPAVRADHARSYLLLAQITGELGEKEKRSLDLYRQALAIFEDLRRRHPDNRAFQRGEALACCALGRACREIGLFEGAEPLLTRALRIQRALLKQTPEDRADLAALARTCSECGRLSGHLRQGRASAEGYFREGLSCLDRLARKGPLAPADLRTQGYLWERLGTILSNHRACADAHEALTRALEVRKRLAGNAPKVIRFQGDLARSYYWLGINRTRMDQKDEALSLHRQALKIRKELVRDHPALIELSVDLGTSHRALANLLGDRLQRVEQLTEAIGVLDACLAREPGHVEALDHLNQSLNARAQTYNGLGLNASHREEARRYYQQAVNDWQRIEKLNQGKNPGARLLHALMLAQVGRHADAIAQLQKLSRNHRVHLKEATPVRVTRLYAVCARAAREDTQLDALTRKGLAGRYLGQALAVLKKGLQARKVKPSECRMMWKDPDFEALWDRPAFRELVGDPK